MKLHGFYSQINRFFRQISVKLLPKTKIQHYCGDLVLGWAVLQKTVILGGINRAPAAIPEHIVFLLLRSCAYLNSIGKFGFRA